MNDTSPDVLERFRSDQSHWSIRLGEAMKTPGKLFRAWLARLAILAFDLATLAVVFLLVAWWWMILRHYFGF